MADGKEEKKDGQQEETAEQKLQKELAELKASREATQKELDALREGNDRLRAEIEASRKKPEESAGDPELGADFASTYGIPIEAATKIALVAAAKAKREAKQEALSEWEKREQQRAALEGIKRQFYQDNPELSRHQVLVGGLAAEYQRLHPNATVEQAMRDVAKQAKEYLKKVASDSGGDHQQEPEHVLGGGGAGQEKKGGGGGGGERELTPEEEIAAEVKERQELVRKAR